MDLAAARARAEERMAQFERMRTRAVELREQVAAIKATATSDDGYITVEVDKRGRLRRLEIDPRVYRRPDSIYLADTITETIRRAAEDADRQVEKALAAYVPAENTRARRDMDFEAPFRRLDEHVHPLRREADDARW